MEKTVHYTDWEKMLLAQLITEEKDIENKKTGATDVKNKAKAWERITKKFASESCTPRSSKQLRKCWDNMKQKKRKLNTAIRHDQPKTGGGPALKQLNDPVMEFVGAARANIDVEIDCPYDSTSEFKKEYFAPTKNSYDDKDEMVHEDTDNVVLHDESIRYKSRSIPPEKEANATSKNLTNCTEKELRLIKLREAIEQQRELHAKKIAIAEAEEKIVILKLLREEEAFGQR